MNKSNSENPGRMSELHLAAVHEDIDEVERLLKEGASPNVLNIDNQPPLLSAVDLHPKNRTASEAIFRILWEKTDENLRFCRDRFGNNVLHLIATFGFDELVEEVFHANPELAGQATAFNAHECPIHLAILNKKESIVQKLLTLDNKSLTYLNGSHHQSALHYAARYGSEELLRECCRHFKVLPQPKDIDKRDDKGMTALAYAKERGDRVIEQILVDYGADESNVSYLGRTQYRP